MKTKILNLFLLLGILVFTSCDKIVDPIVTFESTAIISGSDLAMCACCGGWIIKLDEEESEKRFTELPENTTIDLKNTNLPIRVQLNWTESSDYCGKGIIIDSIELIK